MDFLGRSQKVETDTFDSLFQRTFFSRPLMLVGSAINFAATAAFAVAESYVVLLITGAVQGAAASCFTVAGQKQFKSQLKAC